MRKILDFSEILMLTCTTLNIERMVEMENLDVEVQYRIAKWIFTNMMFSGKITLDEYTEIHKKLIERFNSPMKSIETPGFYVQEAFGNE